MFQIHYQDTLSPLTFIYKMLFPLSNVDIPIVFLDPGCPVLALSPTPSSPLSITRYLHPSFSFNPPLSFPRSGVSCASPITGRLLDNDDDEEIDTMVNIEQLVLEQGQRGLEMEGAHGQGLGRVLGRGLGRGLGGEEDDEYDEEEEEEEEDEDDEDHQPKRIRTMNNHSSHHSNNNNSNNEDDGSKSGTKPEEEVMVIETMKPFLDPRKKVGRITLSLYPLLYPLT